MLVVFFYALFPSCRAKRTREWIIQNIQSDEEFNAKLKEYYDRAILNMNRTIESELSRLAIKENIDINELKQRVKDFDVQEYSIEAKRIVEEADKLRKQGRSVTYEDFSKEVNERLRLYNATMRINRQELLKSLIGLNLIELGANVDASLRQKLTNDYTDEITRQAGILGEFKHPIWTGKEVAKIVMAQTGSANFSKRIWANQDALKARLDASLSAALIQGQNPRKMAQQLRDLVSKEVTNARYSTERIARTESARVQTQAQLKSFRDYGYKFCKWHAEPSACKICREIAENDSGYGVGVYRVDEVPSLPAHPNCRCGLGAYWVDEKDRAEASRLERKKNTEKRVTINKEKQRKLTAEFRKNGGKVWQGSEAEHYLKSRGAAAMTLGDATIVLQNKPTISEVLEELYHIEQFKNGEIDDDISKYKAEIEAQNYLLSVEKMYNIPRREIEETKRNLNYWKGKLENENK